MTTERNETPIGDNGEKWHFLKPEVFEMDCSNPRNIHTRDGFTKLDLPNHHINTCSLRISIGRGSHLEVGPFRCGRGRCRLGGKDTVQCNLARTNAELKTHKPPYTTCS